MAGPARALGQTEGAPKRAVATVLLAAGAWGAGCGCDPSSDGASAREARPDAKAAASASVSPGSSLPPLQASSWRVELDVAGFGDVTVSVPLGATQPRPVVIALHGTFDRPEWQCGTWRSITSAFPFIVCPRGQPHPESPPGSQRFTLGNVDHTQRELRGGLKALKARFEEYVSAGSVILAGFSLGARHAVHLSKQEPSFFSRLVLVEGGHDLWTSSVATIFERAGGERVLFGCTQASCTRRARLGVRWSRRAGLAARLVFPGDWGHVLDGRVARALKKQWDWVVAGDPRYSVEQVP